MKVIVIYVLLSGINFYFKIVFLELTKDDRS